PRVLAREVPLRLPAHRHHVLLNRGPPMGARVEAERDLLFGILALQNGLIEQADLIAAFQVWTKERSCPMAQVLVERGSLSPADRAMLDGLVRRHVEKQGGEPERGVAAVTPPGCTADGLDRGTSPTHGPAGPPSQFSVFADIEESDIGPLTIGVGQLLGREEPADASFTLGQSTSEGGRFRLLRQHARGGIGMVFVALDGELYREVALKQIQPRHADDPN